MDIAQLSYSLAMQNTATAYSFAVMNLSLDTVETAGDGIVKMMETSVNPNIGGNIDIKLQHGIMISIQEKPLQPHGFCRGFLFTGYYSTILIILRIILLFRKFSREYNKHQTGIPVLTFQVIFREVHEAFPSIIGKEPEYAIQNIICQPYFCRYTHNVKVL